MRLTRFVITIIFAAVLGGFFSLYQYLNKGLAPQTFQATEEAMIDQVHLLASIIENDIKLRNISSLTRDEDAAQASLTTLIRGFDEAKKRSFRAKIYEKTKQSVGTNFYVTDHKGIVIYDSGNPAIIGSNYSTYRDVNLTMKGQYGARSTRSAQDNPRTSTMFIAAPIMQGDRLMGVISLYKPKSNVLSFIDARRRWIIFSLSLIGFGIVFFTAAVFFWLFRPLGLLINYARAISDGGRPKFPSLGKGREVNTLGTALREMHDSLEDRKYLENYVQMLTHELKSPLSAIRGASELLNEDMPLEHRKKFLDNIRLETERSQHLIDGLLKLSKLESLKELEHTEFFEIETILKEVARSHKTSLEQKRIHLEIDSSDMHTCRGDSLSIEAALSNILLNAIQFSSEGDSIFISTQSNSDSLTITVRDQGPGIPDYAIERAFENFYSIARLGRSKKSSGLGLAFVREVAQLHQGSATIANHPDGGAIVTLTIKK